MSCKWPPPPNPHTMLPTYIYFAGPILAFLSLLSQTAAGQCKSTVHEIDVSVTSASRSAVISYPPGKQAAGTQKPELPPRKNRCLRARKILVSSSFRWAQPWSRACCHRVAPWRAGCVYVLPLYLFWEIYYQRHLWAANSPSSSPSIGAAAVQSGNLMGRAGRQSLPWQERILPVNVPPFSRERQIRCSSQSSLSARSERRFVCAVVRLSPAGPDFYCRFIVIVFF